MEDLPHAAADMRQVLAAEVQRREKKLFKRISPGFLPYKNFLSFVGRFKAVFLLLFWV